MRKKCPNPFAQLLINLKIFAYRWVWGFFVVKKKQNGLLGKKESKKICRWGLIQLMFSPGKLVNTATKLPRKPERNCPPRLAGSEWFWYKWLSEYGFTSNESHTF